MKTINSRTLSKAQTHECEAEGTTYVYDVIINELPETDTSDGIKLVASHWGGHWRVLCIPTNGRASFIGDVYENRNMLLMDAYRICTSSGYI